MIPKNNFLESDHKYLLRGIIRIQSLKIMCHLFQSIVITVTARFNTQYFICTQTVNFGGVPC